MKRKITFLSAALMLLAFLSVPMGMWGQTTEFEFNLNQLYQNGTLVTAKTVITTSGGTLTFTDQDENFTILLTRNSGNQPGFYTSSGYIRFYINDTFKLSAADGLTLTQVVITPNGSSFNLSSMEGLNTTTRTWTGSASEITFTGSGTNKWDKLTITYTTGGSQTTYYTVTYHANVTGVDDEEDTYAEGTTVTLRPANTFTNEGYTFSEWNTQADGDGDGYAAGDQIEGIDDDLEFYAIWTENTPSDEQWVLTNLADLTANDVFVIVGNNGSNYAMANDNGTSSAPAAVAVTVANEAITSTVAENIQWNIAGNANDGYTFYPNGTTETWLYCYNNNNGLRVGTGSDNAFVINDDYLYNSGQQRYIGIYNSQNWRSYTSINNNIASQTFAFYKKVTSGVVPPSISANNVDIAYDVTSDSITYTINNGVEGGSLTAATTSEWLTLGTVGETVPFTCSANEAATERTATVTLTYTYGDNQTATKNVTVTQTGDPNYTPTIAEVRAQGTGAVVTQGIVTSCVGVTGYIQDATAAICVYGAELTVGDEIRVSGTLTTYKGLLEITSPEVTVISQNNTIEPTVMTIEEINTDYAGNNAWQGWYVTIEDAIVTFIDGQNTTIAQGANTIVVRGISGVEYAVNDILTLDGNIGCYNAAQIANPQNVTVQAAPAEPTITLISNDPTFTPESPYMIEFTHESGGGTSIDQVQCENFSNTLTVDDFSILYCDAEGNALESQEAPVWFLSAPSVTSESNNFYLGVTVDSNPSTTSRTYYFKVGAANVYSDLVTVYQAGYVATITVDPTVVNATAAETDGTLTVAYENINTVQYGADIYWFEDAEGMVALAEAPSWILADFATNDINTIEYTIEANAGEARTAYFKVYGVDIYNNDAYSDMITINQAEYVVDYAELPFEFDGGRAAIATTNGLTQENLGSDYNSSPKLKFDQGNQNNDDKYSTLVLKINERPGTLTFNIKGNSFSGGTFKVQTSEDGETYTDLETYTELTSTVLDESFDNLGENVRYIKWIYTEKSSGNVALGNITLAKYVEPVLVPSITVDPDMVEVNAEEHDGTLDLTYENLTITEMDDFGIQYYDAEGEELTEDPEWIEVLVAEQDPQEGEGYVVSYYMLENEGEARSAYFKVFAADGEDFVYSNLVTVSQAAPEVPFTGTTYTLATTIESGRHYIITNGSDRAMGGQGNNNRAAVEINTVENVAQVDSDDVVELVINGPDANGFYTIYDANVPGYLYAAGGTSSNHLKTQTFCDNKGQWTISFDAETSAASIMANISGNNNARNTMRYNSNSDIFSCYSGGQQAVYLYLKDEETPQYDFYKDITGYGQAENGNYYLIASPIDDADPVAAGMITDELGAQATPETSTYDLYWFDQTQDEEWQNYRQGTFKLASGMGYLYANKENKTIHFDGTPYDGDGSVSLVKDDEADFSGWNLVGNPFGVSAYIDRPFYVMNQDGTELIQSNANDEIAAMQGIFVIANEDGENLTFTPEATDQSANLTLNLSQSRGAVIDRATVSFNDGRQLPKFQLNAESTKLYIPQGNNDYAVVNSNAQGEMPVNFKAQNNGTYTISVNTENLEANYLHLIDNMTGTNIDLLQTPSYTFEAKTTDYASRFRLVFNVTGVEENTTSTEPFAFFNGSEWVVCNMGEATLQVVDMLGRIVSSETVNGNATMTTANLGAGVYVMRLVNGENVKIQKIIIK